MSRLEELIQELCPDGVEYKTLGECVQEISNIKWKTYSGIDKKYIDLSSVDRDSHGITETISINSDTAPSRAQQIVHKDDVILGTTRPMLKRYCTIPNEYDGEICSTGFCVLRAKPDSILPRWIYHNIGTLAFFNYVERNQKGASYPSISDTAIKSFLIPVPPLPVQREMVRILDNFTLLTAELTAELTARKKQYKYYRDALLRFDGAESTAPTKFLSRLLAQHCPNGVEYKALGEVVSIERGKRLVRNQLSEKEGYPVFQNSMAPLGYHTDYNYPENTTFIIGAAAAGEIGFSTEKFWAADDCFPLVCSENISSRYLYHALLRIQPQIKARVRKASIPRLSRSAIERFIIPVPPLPVQKEIVAILDRFDTLCHDLTQGLPAEIEARKKQYEYYRDRLLRLSPAAK